MSIVTRARLERTKEEEEARTHLSTERERERERGATDDHHRDCFCGALCVLLFFGGGSSILVVVVDSFAAAKGVALTTRLDRRRQSRPSFRARARALDSSERKTPPPRRSLRFARLVIDASLKPLRLLSLRALCTPGDGDRETERTLKSAFFPRFKYETTWTD